MHRLPGNFVPCAGERAAADGAAVSVTVVLAKSGESFFRHCVFFYDVRTESLEATGENFLGSCHEFNGRLSLARKLGGENQSFTGAEAFRDQQMMRERRLV